MIEHGGRKYYTTFELLDFIRDTSDKGIGKEWEEKFPNSHKTILLEHVSRILIAARKAKQIKYLEFKKNENSSKHFYAYSIEDVKDFLKSYTKEVYDVKIHEKE